MADRRTPADERLISEMLAALKSAQRLFEPHCLLNGSIYDEIKAAIAKAENRPA